jgi:hypothetical protein
MSSEYTWSNLQSVGNPCWHHLYVHAQQLFCCSFSYIPALFAKGAIYYKEFWSKPLAHWLTNTTLIRQVDRPIKISMKEITIPCEGGVFGAQTTQMHACIISKQTTPRFTDIPDIAQTVYPCWSWFGEKQAKNCVFVVKDRLSHKWFNFISSIMGCLVISKQPFSG